MLSVSSTLFSAEKACICAVSFPSEVTNSFPESYFLAKSAIPFVNSVIFFDSFVSAAQIVNEGINNIIIIIADIIIQINFFIKSLLLYKNT